MKLRDILFPIAALTVGIGAGVAIGWFSKPDDDTNTPSDDSISLINDFMERVTPSRLGENLRKISGQLACLLKLNNSPSRKTSLCHFCRGLCPVSNGKRAMGKYT